jgi:hypothetical protein
MSAVCEDLFLKRGATYSPCGKLRFTLTRWWADGPRACYIGHNPSTAGHEVDDPTSIAWVHFARAQGYGSYVAVNLYPYRSPNPDECRRWARYEENGPDWWARDRLMQNEMIVAQEAKSAQIVVACWGAIAQDDNWTAHVIEAIQTEEAPWPDIYCLGKTASGAPIHPMARGKHRVPRDRRFELWRAA